MNDYRMASWREKNLSKYPIYHVAMHIVCPLCSKSNLKPIWCWLSDLWQGCVQPQNRVRKHAKVRVCVCVRTCVRMHTYVCVCVGCCVHACKKLLLVGPSMTAEVGTIICSAVISINTFLDAHTLSQRSCAQHPLRMWPAACRHMAASQALITTQQPVG